MPRQPVTLWHKYHDAVFSRRLGFYMPNSVISQSDFDLYADYRKVRQLVVDMATLPKLVISNQLYEAMPIGVLSSSLEAMCDANVLRLPYKRVIVEISLPDAPDERWFFLCEEGGFTIHGSQQVYPFRVTLTSYYGKYDHAVVQPVQVYLSFENRAEDGAKRESWIGVAAPNAPYMRSYALDVLKDELAAASKVLSSYACRAISVALVVSNVRGVEKEVIEPKALNRARAKKGKVPVPRHTYLHIGHVYSRTGAVVKHNETVDGRSTKIHLRRGHTRNQRYGKDWSESRLIYIEPVLVNYHPGDDIPAPTTVVKW